MADLLPVTLPDRKDTFHRDPAKVELTAAGRDSLLCRLDDDPARNAERWKKLPYLQNYQEAGTPKAGAVVLAELTAHQPRQASSAGDAELWPRTHGRLCDGGFLALADVSSRSKTSRTRCSGSRCCAGWSPELTAQ